MQRLCPRDLIPFAFLYSPHRTGLCKVTIAKNDQKGSQTDVEIVNGTVKNKHCLACCGCGKVPDDLLTTHFPPTVPLPYDATGGFPLEFNHGASKQDYSVDTPHTKDGGAIRF